MTSLIDATVLSAALRRFRPPSSASRLHTAVQVFRELASDGQAVVLGVTRQEVLSGLADRAAFLRLRDALRTFPDAPVVLADYERAAEFSNTCRNNGIQGAATDFLLCAVSVRLGFAILTTDRDFESYAQHVPVTLVSI